MTPADPVRCRTSGSGHFDVYGVAALEQQVPPDRELEAPLQAVDPVARDRVVVPHLRRREHPAAVSPRTPVHLHLGIMNGCTRSSGNHRT